MKMEKVGLSLRQLGEIIQQDMCSLQGNQTGTVKLHLPDYRDDDIALDVNRETCMGANKIERENQQMEKDQQAFSISTIV